MQHRSQTIVHIDRGRGAEVARKLRRAVENARRKPEYSVFVSIEVSVSTLAEWVVVETLIDPLPNGAYGDELSDQLITDALNSLNPQPTWRLGAGWIRPVNI